MWQFPLGNPSRAPSTHSWIPELVKTDSYLNYENAWIYTRLTKLYS